MIYPIHIFLSNVFCKQVITSFTAFQVMPKETSCQFHSTFCSISEVLQWITSIICINEFSQTIRIYFHHSRFVHIQNVTKIKGKLWRFFFWSCLEIGCRHGITVLCGCVGHLLLLKLWVCLISMTAFLEDLNFCAQALPSFSTLLMTFADSHHWLHCQKSGITSDGWDPPFFWQWRHPSEMSMTSLEIIS